MPQVAQDKRCFPLNKETVTNTFVDLQVCVNVCVCGHLRMLVCAHARHRKLTHKFCC